MKYQLAYGLSICAIMLHSMSCTKDTKADGAASLTIVNAVVGSEPLITNFSGRDSILYLNANSIPYGEAREFGNYINEVKLGLFQYPDTTSHNAPLIDVKLNLSVNTINTLYLTGTVALPETVFVIDEIPIHSDSVVGIRFVNLSPGSNPVNIRLSTDTTRNLVDALAYKGVSSFGDFPVTAAVANYTFQFQDAVTGAILDSYDMNGIDNGTGNNINSSNPWRYKNVTLALRGTVGGTGVNAQKVMLINNY